MDDIVKEFLDEEGEHLEGMDKNLLILEGSIDKGVDKDIINTIFRSAHSLKGVSGMLGFMTVSKLTHRMENVLDKLRSGEMGITPKIIDTLFTGLDKLGELLRGIKREGVEQLDISDYVSHIESLLGQSEAGKKAASLRGAEAAVETVSRTALNISKELSERIDKGEEAKIIEQLKSGEGNVYEITLGLNRDCFNRGIGPIDFYKDVESVGQVISVIPVNLKPLPIEAGKIVDYDIEIIMLLSTSYDSDYLKAFLGSNELKINAVKEVAEEKGMQPFDTAKYFQAFIEGTEEEIEKLNHEILKLENIKGAPEEAVGGDLQDTLNEIFRLCHRIKGSSAAMGYKSISEVAHDGETILCRLRDKKLSITGEVIDILLKIADFFLNAVEKLKVEKNPVIVITDIKEKIGKFIEKACSERSESNGDKSRSAPAIEKKSAQIGLSEYHKSLASEAIEKGKRVFKVNVFLKEKAPMGYERAFLIKNGLEELGSLIKFEPDPSVSLEGGVLPEIEYISALISTESDEGAIRKVVDVDMVETINIESYLPPPSPPSLPRSAWERAATQSVATREGEGGLSERRDSTAQGRRLSDIGQVSTPGQTIRVDISRLDNLMNLTGELVISKARINQFGLHMKDIFNHQRIFSLLDSINSSIGRLKVQISMFHAQGFKEGEAKDLELFISELEMEIKHLYRKRTILLDFIEEINNLGRLTMGIQNSVMESRMVPVGQLFHRFERVVRDLAKDRGKEVRLEISGEETELDKKVIDELGDPLTHMVRNAIDHGIETAEDREKAGKGRTAILKLDASRSGNYICVEVSDDGKGIDVDTIRKKVLEKGLSEPDKVSKMSEKELIDFIFLPGFSTASKVTDISGRGVGLDVVKQKIDGLGGQVDIVTEKGRGTKFIIKLPLTLAIVSALLAKAEEETYSIPLDSVREIVRFKRNEIHKLDANDTVKLRGKVITIVPLQELLSPHTYSQRLPMPPTPISTISNAHSGRFPTVEIGVGAGIGVRGGQEDIITTVIVGSQDKHIGIVVDSLLGEQDIVIKSLGDHFSSVVGISGASILGNGEISLILDIPALIERTEIQ